jgi:hypothetical protein
LGYIANQHKAKREVYPAFNMPQRQIEYSGKAASLLTN